MKFSTEWLKNANTQAHILACRDTVLVLFFTTLPLLLGIFSMYVNSNWQGLDVFYQRGEFFLYALSLIVSSYQVYNHFKIKPTDLKSIFSVISLVLLVLCSTFYAILSASKTPNIDVIRLCSLSLMVVSLPLFYYAQVISNSKSPNLAFVRDDESKGIADQLS